MLQTIKILYNRPRLIFSVGVILLLGIILPYSWAFATRLLVAWDIGIGLYLVLAAHMAFKSSMSDLRLRAVIEDEGGMAILALTTISALASLAAIIVELATAKSLFGYDKAGHIGLAGVTVFLSWSFMQTIFALHYAYEYYSEQDGNLAKGLDFPGEDKPDYWDFVYYSFVIGVAAQTADVNISSKTIRRITTVHGLVVFFFNTTILALTVNICSGLF